jgi:prepilin-type N-terminal cleavage/methylation domain-containing protein
MKHLAQRLRVAGAFTLIEMLAVVAVIGILVALLSRAIVHGVAKAQEASCQNNLRQLSIMLMMIAEGRRPLPTPATIGDSYFGPQRALLAELHPHLRGASNLLFCPRSVRLEKLNIDQELQAGRIGYYYWGWKAAATPQPLYLDDTTSVWLQFGWNPNVGKLVLMTDRFRDKAFWPIGDDWQFHAPPDVERTLSEPGTLAVLADGSVRKIAPRP